MADISAEHGILVIGRGAVTSAPDIVVITLGVSVLAPTAPEAISNAARAATALVDSLRSAGIAEADVSTTRYGIHQESHHTDQGPIPTGYRVVNTMNAVVRDVTGVGGVIDAAASAAGDSIEVQGISFSHSDDTAARQAARDLAFADARSTAAQLAALSGRELGPVQWISEGTFSGGGAPRVALRASFSEASTPVSGGELTTAVQVEIRFALADKP